jgi:hypothetical protein
MSVGWIVEKLSPSVVTGSIAAVRLLVIAGVDFRSLRRVINFSLVRKKGTDTAAAMSLLTVYRVTPRSQSPFSANAAPQC